MALPQSVQQAADYADSVEKQILEGGAGQPKADDTPAPTAIVTDQSVANVDENQSELQKYKERFNSLRGKYDAEVPRLHEETRSLREQLARLQEENKAAREQLAKHVSEKSYLTEQDVETYGEDLMDVIKRGAYEATKEQAKKTAYLEAQIEQLRQQAESARRSTEVAERNEFERQVASVCPDWRQYDTDQGFSDWLDEEDPNYGVQRKLAFNHAVQARDGIRTGRIFKMYVDSLKPAQNPLAKQVTPDHRAAAPAPQQPKMWTETMMNKFYTDCRRGVIPPEAAEKIEQELNEAIAAGRFRPGV